MTPNRIAVILLAVLLGWQVGWFEMAALPSIILAAAAVVAILVAEETRVREARRDADEARERECHHGGTSWGPFDANGNERERGRS